MCSGLSFTCLCLVWIPGSHRSYCTHPSNVKCVMADQVVCFYVVGSSIPRGVDCFGSTKRRCCQEVRIGGMVSSFEDSPWACVMLELHRLPSKGSWNSLWSKEGRLYSHLRSHFIMIVKIFWNQDRGTSVDKFDWCSLWFLLPDVRQCLFKDTCWYL